jgi:hypothetical protein
MNRYKIALTLLLDESIITDAASASPQHQSNPAGFIDRPVGSRYDGPPYGRTSDN